MKLAVFGASGRTGRQLLHLALARGDELTVLVRDPSRLPPSQGPVHVVEGDVHDVEAVGRTIAGADAVISVLGQHRGSGHHVLRVGIRNIIWAMEEAGVRRLVVLSITVVRDPADRPRTIDRLLERVGRILAANVYEDHLGQAAELRQTDLDWTIVRAPLLTYGPRTGRYRVGSMGAVGGRVSRADVADFLLEQATDTTFYRRLPLVGS